MSPGNPPSFGAPKPTGGDRLGGMQQLRPGAVSAAASPRSDASGCSLGARLPPLSADSPPSPASRLQHAGSHRPLPTS